MHIIVVMKHTMYDNYLATKVGAQSPNADFGGTRAPSAPCFLLPCSLIWYKKYVRCIGIARVVCSCIFSVCILNGKYRYNTILISTGDNRLNTVKVIHTHNYIYIQLQYVYTYSSNPWESNHRDGPTGHNKNDSVLTRK